ncbi:MAG: N-acetyl-gamma-glutamyl-phosphate reductase, partial [Eubacteriales bacterium]|nr:N-acetyl-gamma-glutamyl-phosphate reductase [Eubacteriales bacterium]
MAKVFIDGQAGTAGLELYERLNQHGDVELLEIDPERRKDDAARAALMNEADVVFLCLPDAAAIEAVRLVENPKTVVIDASTAHRVTEGWVYGLPELAPGQREAIAEARRIANPGCYATGFLLAVRPLIELHLADADYPFACQGLSGYSGAGKAAIAGYQAADRPVALSSPRQYGLSLKHKHLPEMRAYAGLDEPPLFTPVICDFYRGMA